MIIDLMKKIKKKKEKAEWENRPPEEKLAGRVQLYEAHKEEEKNDSHDYSEIWAMYSVSYKLFKELIGKADGAKEYAGRALYDWYRSLFRTRREDLVAFNLKEIIDEVNTGNYEGTDKWKDQLLENYEWACKIKEEKDRERREEELREKREEAAARAREIEEEREWNLSHGYGDTSSISADAYDNVDLSILPDMFFFTGNPDTVYQHYGYMTGGAGQKVRVYQSLDGGNKVSISWVNIGYINDGRTFNTDQGTIEKYL